MTKYLVCFCLAWISICAKPYVTCHFDGQLGNQLFQAATAIAFAIDHDCKPVFPSAQHLLHRKFVFHRLDMEKLSKKVKFHDYYENLYSRHMLYDPIPYTKRNLCIHGFFQTENYFKHHKTLLQNLFAPSQKITQKIFKKYGELLHQQTVALHIRTFIPDGRDPNIEGFNRVGWDYFLRAMNYFPEEYSILVFSDSIEWVKTNFPPCSRKLIFIEDNPSYFDFYFMSFCKHQIVSPGSTFSWWAAWLNRNPEKIVVASSEWVATATPEAIPGDWIQM